MGSSSDDDVNKLFGSDSEDEDGLPAAAQAEPATSGSAAAADQAADGADEEEDNDQPAAAVRWLCLLRVYAGVSASVCTICMHSCLADNCVIPAHALHCNHLHGCQTCPLFQCSVVKLLLSLAAIVVIAAAHS